MRKQAKKQMQAISAEDQERAVQLASLSLTTLSRDILKRQNLLNTAIIKIGDQSLNSTLVLAIAILQRSLSDHSLWEKLQSKISQKQQQSFSMLFEKLKISIQYGKENQSNCQLIHSLLKKSPQYEQTLLNILPPISSKQTQSKALQHCADSFDLTIRIVDLDGQKIFHKVGSGSHLINLALKSQKFYNLSEEKLPTVNDYQSSISSCKQQSIPGANVPRVEGFVTRVDKVEREVNKPKVQGLVTRIPQSSAIIVHHNSSTAQRQQPKVGKVQGFITRAQKKSSASEINKQANKASVSSMNSQVDGSPGYRSEIKFQKKQGHYTPDLHLPRQDQFVLGKYTKQSRLVQDYTPQNVNFAKKRIQSGASLSPRGRHPGSPIRSGNNGYNMLNRLIEQDGRKFNNRQLNDYSRQNRGKTFAQLQVRKGSDPRLPGMGFSIQKFDHRIGTWADPRLDPRIDPRIEQRMDRIDPRMEGGRADYRDGRMNGRMEIDGRLDRNQGRMEWQARKDMRKEGQMDSPSRRLSNFYGYKNILLEPRHMMKGVQNGGRGMLNSMQRNFSPGRVRGASPRRLFGRQMLF